MSNVVEMPAAAEEHPSQVTAFTLFQSVKRTEGLKSVFVTMPTDDFMAIRGFGLNRDVSKRLTAKKNTHLQGELTSAQQCNVAVVITSPENKDFYVDGQPIMKIDGHSRCAAWESGALTKPDFVNVQFFFDLSDAEIVTEYKVFTNSLAQATVAEQNQIDCKLNHFEPESAFVKASWKDAFKKQFDITYDEGLKKYGSLLLDIIDKWEVKPEVGKASTKRHSTGVKMAILYTYDSEDYTNWEIFWKDFFAEESLIKQCAGLRDTVKGLGTHNPNPVKDACTKAFAAFEKAQAKKAA